MASRSSRYEPRHDDAYPSANSYPDPQISLNDDAYEYVGPDAFPEPPPHTFDDRDRDASPPRRRSSPRRHRSNRASTQPPISSSLSPPPKLRRAASPPARSSRYSDSSPRRSKRDASPPKPSKPVAVGKQSRRDRFSKKPTAQNMKSYGRKGLNALGNVVEAYAAAQAPPLDSRGRPRGRGYDYADDGYYPPNSRDRYLDPYERPRRSRRGYSLSPSPSPPRRSTERRTNRRRPPLNGRQKSFSVSPSPLSRNAEYDRDRGRRHDRRSRQPSLSSTSSSVSPRPRRRARSHPHARDSSAETVKTSRRRASMNAAKEHLASPNPEIARRWQLAARAALEAGGVTAFRLRKEPGSWTGAKGAKVATAALGAAAIDAFIDKDPRRGKQGGMKGMAESVIGGLIASKMMGFKSSTTRHGTYRY